MPFIQHLTSFRVFSSLLPREHLFGIGEDTDKVSTILDEIRDRTYRLLFYPPDLFAYTSAILGTTGAYYLVVSPAKDLVNLDSADHTWAPKSITRDNEDNPNSLIEVINFDNDWSTKVWKLGVDWRKFLNRNFDDIKKVITDTSKVDIEELLKTIINNDTDVESINYIFEIFKLYIKGCDEENISEMLCKKDSIIDSMIRSDKSKLSRSDYVKQNNEEINKRLNQVWNAYCSLVTLHAIADEACLGFGIRDYIRIPEYGENKKSELQEFAEEQLERYGTLSTIHPDRCRVLPKRHTPNVGMTLRNLSSNIAFTRASVKVKWRKSEKILLTEEIRNKTPDEPINISSLNVLLIPCPMKINARDFKVMDKVPRIHQSKKDNEAYFEYSPDEDVKSDSWNSGNWENNNERAYKDKQSGFKNWLDSLFARAINEAGRIDLVILPETAISFEQKSQLEEAICNYSISGYIAGVRTSRNEIKGRRLNRNFVICNMKTLHDDKTFKFPEIKEEDIDIDCDYIQHKHHRWRLSESQIIQYQLGGILSTEKTWWEGTKVSQRKVTFMNIGENVTICPLICEDLARQEPISDLIRAVGPTLVVSVLMDGPQLGDRWSASYAGILADDPRSSMLTLSCAGLVDRWKSSYRDAPRVVAYWKDNLSYRQEIELEKDKEAIVLYLNTKTIKEATADGRKEHIGTPYLVFGGMKQV